MARQTETSMKMLMTNKFVKFGIAGLLAGIPMGIILVLLPLPIISAAIPALWGLSGAVAGWTIHLLNSFIFGILYGFLVDNSDMLSENTTNYGNSIVVGIGYGIILWIIFAVIVMPIWLSTVGFAGAPSVPNFSTGSLLAHLVYGLTLGTSYKYFEGNM